MVRSDDLIAGLGRGELLIEGLWGKSGCLMLGLERDDLLAAGFFLIGLEVYPKNPEKGEMLPFDSI